MNDRLFSFHSDSPAVVVLGVFWLIVWLMVMAHALRRTDLDPVTKLMWVLVVILVPIAGVFFYWFIAPPFLVAYENRPSQPKLDEPIRCVQCRTLIPGDATACPKCGWSYVEQSG